ncbi:MAG: M24 family metallopeptidase [Thermodesulfobacteriota bacterium]|nr:M24 family metallopeptidase [Thermodesulfobacteriota bacterium]
MEDQKQILTESISTDELQRRWKEVRGRMNEEKIDFLVMQNDNEWLGGYVKWFTDIPARNGYPMTVIFPIDDEMTTITSGGKPPGDLGPPPWTMRGVKKRLTAPYFRSLWYSNTYDAELALDTLKVKKKAKIGIVGKGSMSAMFYEHMRKGLPEAIFVDATDMVDRIKAIKSNEEIALIKKTVALQDEAIEYAKKVIRPGRRDFEIVADIVHKVTDLGSEEQLVIGGSGPVGRPVPMQKRHYQNRTVREGDQFTLMIEVNGPGGMYAEVGRIFFLGKVPSELQDAYELCKETQKATLKFLKPGADPADIWRANNEFLIKKGQLPETRLFAHGQGYDLVERPAIRDDEPMKLKAGMNITVHPTIGSNRVWVWVCDNYLITESGGSECLHKAPQEIFEV